MSYNRWQAKLQASTIQRVHSHVAQIELCDDTTFKSIVIQTHENKQQYIKHKIRGAWSLAGNMVQPRMRDFKRMSALPMRLEDTASERTMLCMDVVPHRVERRFSALTPTRVRDG